MRLSISDFSNEFSDREQWLKNDDYRIALQSDKWMDAIRALNNGAQAGYVDPYTGLLDIQLAAKGGELAKPLFVVLKTLYSELARAPQAPELVAKIIETQIPQHQISRPPVSTAPRGLHL